MDSWGDAVGVLKADADGGSPHVQGGLNHLPVLPMGLGIAPEDVVPAREVLRQGVDHVPEGGDSGGHLSAMAEYQGKEDGAGKVEFEPNEIVSRQELL